MIMDRQTAPPSGDAVWTSSPALRIGLQAIE